MRRTERVTAVSRGVWALVGAGLLLLVAGCGGDQAESSGSVNDPRASASRNSPVGSGIPIRATKDGSGVVVDVSVGGGAPVPLLLDTGSAGLRIFGTDAGPDVQDVDAEPTSAPFVDGTIYTYESALAPVVIGGVASSQPLPIDVVSKVTCDTEVPDCVPGIEEEVKSGNHGILGVAMSSDDEGTTPSPLLALPEYRSFTLAVDSDGSGMLRPGLPAGEPIGTWKLGKADSGVPGVQGWAPGFRACWSLGSAPPACVPTAFDSGSTDVLLQPSLPGTAREGVVTADDGPLALHFPTAQSAPIWSLKPDDEAAAGVSVAAPGDDSTETVLAGLPLFHAYDVAFDQTHGTVSLYAKG